MVVVEVVEGVQVVVGVAVGVVVAVVGAFVRRTCKDEMRII